MHAIFTQIYDKTENKIPEILENTPNDLLQQMPYIIDAELTLDDINKITELRPKTDVIKWILENKE